jgi:hypothetical protein
MANLDNSYKEIRASQLSLHDLACKVPKVAVTVQPVTTVKSERIDTELTVLRNDQEIQVFESFFPEGDIKYMCGIRIEREKDVKTYCPFEQRRELLPDLIKKHTDRKNVKWFMTPEQYKSFQDHVRKLDCPDTIGDFGAVQVGRFLFLFNLENRRDRELNGYGPENHRIGTLYLAGIPKGKPFCGELDNGVRFTSLTDLVFQNFEEWMRGHYEIGDCPEDISKLTFPVFKDRMEEWVVDNAEVLKTVADAIAKGEAPADMLTTIEPGWEAWVKSSCAKPTNAETENDPFTKARAEMEAIFEKARKDLDEICNRYIEKIKNS